MNELVAGGIVSGILAAVFVRGVVLVSMAFAILAGLALLTVALAVAALLVLTLRKLLNRSAALSRTPVVGGT